MPPKFTQGDFPPNPLEKPGYSLDFNDEFDGPELSLDKWIPFYLPHWSSGERSRPNYTFRDGNLVLQITREQQPWCPEFDGENRASVIQSGQFSGPRGSKTGQLRFNRDLVVREEQQNVKKYTPQYGYIEIRSKGLDSGGNHVSLWMCGYEDKPEKSAEICLFEIVGARTTPTSSRINYGVHKWTDPAITEEFYEEVFELDARAYHIFAVEWTPTHLDFYIDNQKIRTIRQSPVYEMQIYLGMFEDPSEKGWNGPFDPNRPYPKEFVVDYVRVYRPEQGYPNPSSLPPQ